MKVLEVFKSKRNQVRLVENHGSKYVLKQFEKAEDFHKEYSYYKRLRDKAIKSPTLMELSEKDLSLELEYIQGVTLLEYLEGLEEESNIDEAVLWLTRLINTYQLLSATYACYYKDVNLRNFIIAEGSIYLLDFEALEQGHYIPVAETLAYYLLYHPVKTSFKHQVVTGLIQQVDCYKSDRAELSKEIEHWVMQIEKRRSQKRLY